MGLFTGNNNEKSVQEYNDFLLNDDKSSNKLPQQLDLIQESLSNAWRNSTELCSDMLSKPDKFWHDVLKSTTEDGDLGAGRNASGRSLDTDAFVDDIILNASDAVGSVLSGMGFPGGFGHPFKIRNLMQNEQNDEIIKQGVTGLYSFKNPTNAQFTRCSELEGLSVWDTKGWWRCLFPEQAVKGKLGDDADIARVLTRERVEQDANHALGLFFPDYSGYLNWRSYMIKLSKQKREEQLLSSKELALNATPEDLMHVTGDKGKRVVGNSNFVTYNSTEDGQEQIKETKTYFSDGTVSIKSEKRLTPNDGTAPKVETFEKVVSRDDDSTKDGWFWRK